MDHYSRKSKRTWKPLFLPGFGFRVHGSPIILGHYIPGAQKTHLYCGCSFPAKTGSVIGQCSWVIEASE